MSEFKEIPSVKAILVKARELIASAPNWTQGRFAVDRHGGHTDYYQSTAHSFCMLGALRRADYELSGSAPENFLFSKAYDHAIVLLEDDSAVKARGGSAWRFNDSVRTTHKEVLNVFDRAIEKAPQS